jgi:tetratricopeptide (TPR) repeat protein
LLRVSASVLLHYGELSATLSNGLTFARYEPVSGVTAGLVMLLLAAVGGFFCYLWYRAPKDQQARAGVWAGLVWFALGLAPTALVIPILGMYQNRYCYFPLLGLVLTFASLAELARARLYQSRTLSRPKAAALLIGVAFFGLLALTTVRTRLESGAWASNASLAQSDLLSDPDNHFALYHLAHALSIEGGCKKALPFYARAAELSAGYARAWDNFTGCLVELGRYADAEAPARHALALTPDSAAAHYHLGVILIGTGHRDRGKRELERALKLAPTHAPSRKVLAYLADPAAAFP